METPNIISKTLNFESPYDTLWYREYQLKVPTGSLLSHFMNGGIILKYYISML